MYAYAVGEIIDRFINHSESTLFDIDDSGATMLAFMKHPTPVEIEQFKVGTNIEIRFTELHNVIMITAKIGSLNWMDAPYSPHLSRNLTMFQIPNKNLGLKLTLILVDAATGEIKYIRALGLSGMFTKQLFCAIMDQKMKDFDRSIYEKSIYKIFSTYPTTKIAKISKHCCKF